MLIQILAITLMAYTFTSCATSGRRSSQAHIQVMSSGMISIEGRPVSIDRIGHTLKKRGFPLRSPVNVHVPRDISPRILKAITISLTNKGFHRILFVKPKQSVADVTDPQKGRR